MLLALLAALALSQHAHVDPEVEFDQAVERAEERLAELERAIEEREHELELVTAQAERLVELLARERGVPVDDLVDDDAVEEGDEPGEHEADTGDPDPARENEYTVEIDGDEEGT